ncbi:RHS repeat-associated core domain-containing protein, partial [Nonlabens tegetincola]|uniref:RHS repeat-associated core domain-containing protein n=1 Tax=Nonlabens tegetincola TaxID=323273 RepID=UPI00272ED907
GNIRLSYQDMNNDGNVDSSEIKEENNYYPFGLEHKGYNNVVNGSENNHQTFMGQEKEEELGKDTYAFQWRDYDPATARFGKIDRFSEMYYNTSPYAFVKNNLFYIERLRATVLRLGQAQGRQTV